MTQPTDQGYAAALDAADPLAHFRQRFVIDDSVIYLDGNSLGRLPLATAARAEALVGREWAGRLIRGWNEGWFDAPERIGAKIARLIGAQPDEVIVADSTSVNLFKLAVAALRLQRGRTRILSDSMNFPSDLYILQGAIELLEAGHELAVLPSEDGIHGPAAALAAQCDERTALLTLSHTVFKSGYTYDMAALTAAAHAAGALVLWDLSHSVGALPIDLNGAGADLAIGCTYKYLNGGPGAPAFLYIRRDLQEQLLNPISGWMGQRNLFAFEPDYRPAPGLRRFLTGTPPVVSLALVEPGVDLLLEAGVDALREKSLRQTDYLIGLWEALLAPLGFVLNTPRDPQRRGSHLSLGHPEALGIDLALINEGRVLPDFRAPDNIRLGIAPLYTSYTDIHTAILRMEQIVAERRYAAYSGESPTVT
ncbi:MAG TPA: kynureninase [Roseiflexaceae bacterium]|nr:kynureninase [Roseiflexaceae bacterium]